MEQAILGHGQCRQVPELQLQKLPHPKGLEASGKGVELSLHREGLETWPCFVRGPPNGRTLFFFLPLSEIRPWVAHVGLRLAWEVWMTLNS